MRDRLEGRRATATFEDLADKIASRPPIFIALVAGLSVLLLMAVFRSLWVPLVSAVFNLLSILAAYDVVVKTIWLGLAAAILIDVLVVRMVVAPAVMALLGDRAWGLPGWLDRLLPKLSLEGEDLVQERPLVPA